MGSCSTSKESQRARQNLRERLILKNGFYPDECCNDSATAGNESG